MISGLSKEQIMGFRSLRGECFIGTLKAHPLSGKKPKGINFMDLKDSEIRVVLTIRMCLANKVMYHVMDKESLAKIWLKLESR